MSGQNREAPRTEGDYSDVTSIPNHNLNSQEYFCTYAIGSLGGKYKIHSFQTFVLADQLMKGRDIQIVSDLSDSVRWGFSEQIQRVINRDRVKAIANRYLLNDSKDLKFFPAITVALLPFTNGHPKDFYSYLGNPGLEGIDGIKIDKLRKELIEPICKLSWNLKQICAVAVDGQHRVAAVRQAAETRLYGFAEVRIPVVFLIMDPASKEGIVGKVRELFIDVNTTPRPVAEERLVFLDDRNIARRTTRASLQEPEYLGALDRDWRLVTQSQITRVPLEWVKMRDEAGNEDHGTPPINFFPLVDLFTLHRVTKDFIFGDWSYNSLVTTLDQALGRDLSQHIDNCDTKLKAESMLDRLSSEDDSIAQVEPVYRRYISDYKIFASEESTDDDDPLLSGENRRKEIDDFSFDSATADAVLEKTKSTTSDLLAYAFTNQKWVINASTAIRECEQLKGDRLVQMYFQAYLLGRSKNQSLSIDLFLERLNITESEQAVVPRLRMALAAVQKRLIDFENPEGSDCSENILRYSVGQRMLLSHVTDAASLFPTVEGGTPFQYVELYMDKVRKLESIGFFRRSFKLKDNEESLLVWNNLLVRVTNGDLVMRPTDSDAENGWRFLFLVIRNICGKGPGSADYFISVAKRIGSAYLNVDNYSRLLQGCLRSHHSNLTQKQVEDVERLLGAQRKIEEVFNDCRVSSALLYGSRLLSQFVTQTNAMLLKSKR